MKRLLFLPMFLAAGFACLAGAMPADAAAAAPARHDNNAPINVSADQFLADLNAKSGTYSGNVIVTQGDVHMHADTVRVNVVDGKPDKILANGKVVVDSPVSGTATGDNGVYNVPLRTVVLTGHVVLTQGKNVMRGTMLTVNLVTGQAQLGAAKAPGAPGANANGSGRVQGIFTPPPQTQTKSPSKPQD